MLFVTQRTGPKPHSGRCYRLWFTLLRVLWLPPTSMSSTNQKTPEGSWVGLLLSALSELDGHLPGCSLQLQGLWGAEARPKLWM